MGIIITTETNRFEGVTYIGSVVASTVWTLIFAAYVDGGKGMFSKMFGKKCIECDEKL